MLTKEQLQTFRAAPWTSKQDVGAYLATAEDIEPQDLVTLLRMVDERRLSPVIDRVLPLREAPEGLRLLAEREVIGKVVVVP